jgi:hypothetical protein
MKKITGTMLLAAALASGSALGAGPEAYVLADKPPAYGIIPASSMIYALTLNRRCDLPIANAHNLKMAEIFNNRSHPERPDIGCWGVTQDPSHAEVVVIGPTGFVSSGMSLTQFTRVSLQADGSALTIGPAMTQEEYLENVRRYEKSLR